MLSIEEFIMIFPEFNDMDKYPQSQISIWLEFSNNLVNEKRWKSSTKMGIALLTAHELYLSNSKGLLLGPPTSQSVDGVSESYYTGYINANWGIFGTTTYGLQFMQLCLIFGSGPLMAV